MESPLDKSSPLAQAVRFGVELLIAWLRDPAREQAQWRQDDFQAYRALCQQALTFLHPHNTTVLPHSISYRVILSLGEAEPQEEWWERSKVWEAEIHATRLRCSTYSNLATMTGASQTPIFSSTEPELSSVLRAELDTWKLELDTALSHPNVFVSLTKR